MRVNTIKILKIDLVLLVIALLVSFAYFASDPAALSDLVDQVRNVIGPEPVALAENTFYGATDALQRATFSGNTTPGFWPTPDPASSAAASAPAKGSTAPPSNTQSAKTPRNITPLYPNIAAPDEGAWISIPNGFDPTAAPLMYKTFLHADPARPYARIAIVAMNMTRLRFHIVAGTIEPVSTAHVPRPGLVSGSDQAQLAAAFNGGFKAIHGHYGMMVDGQSILPPVPDADTIALYRDGQVRIAPWSVISDTLPAMASYRQTPIYLAYQGHVNPTLTNERIVTWGAAVSGQTAIWRSAIGISADGRTLYYGAGDSLTAQRLAEALVAAGAGDVAELDANAAHEQFLFYTPAHGNPTEQILVDQMVHRPGLYVSSPSARDFFYLTVAK